MNIKIFIFAKLSNNSLKDLSSYYSRLVSKYATIKIIQVKSSADSKIKKEILDKYLKKGKNILLYEKGENLSTIQFTNYLNKLKLVTSNINFYIGNAWGFEKEAYKSSEKLLSLSSMTFSHQLSLVILLEQLFRCLNLAAGGKYHK